MSSRSAAGRRPLPGSPFSPPPPSSPETAHLTVSDRVLHDRHGMGTVLAVEGPAVVRVDFGSGGVRRVRSAVVTKL